MKNPLRQEAYHKAMKNIQANIAIGLFCGLAMVLVTMLSIIDFSFLIIALPLFLLPFIFASHVSSYYLQINQPVSMRTFFNYFLGYFRPQFKGTFRALISFAKSILIYVIGLFVFNLIFYMIFKAHYGEIFVSEFSNIVNHFSIAETSIEDINNLLNANTRLLFTFFTYVQTAAIFPLMTSFLYFISFASISLYYRANIPAGTAPIMRLSINNTYRQYGRKMKRDWWALNWPLLLLSLLGMAIAASINLFAIRDVALLPAVTLIGSVALLWLFLPFYFSNMEVIYKKYENRFKQGNKQTVTDIIQKIQASIDFNVEEKKTFEESLENEQDEEKE